MTGYQIREEIKSSTAHFWSESAGQIYPALNKSIDQGLTTVEEIPASGNMKVKKIYSITKKGKTHLSEWLRADYQPVVPRNELLLKLFFGASIEPLESIHQLTTRKKKITQAKKLLNGIKQELNLHYAESKHYKYWLITIEYGLAHAKFEAKWCDNSIALLKAE